MVSLITLGVLPPTPSSIVSSPASPSSPSSPIVTTFKCPMCYKPYKRQVGLANHIKTINEANVKKPGVYWLPPEAITEIKTAIVYEIKNKLKQHAKYTGSYRVKIKCTESEFFWVFSGYIHQFNSKSGSYKCIFRGETAYTTLSQVFNDTNWGVKYFGHTQKTFVLTYIPPQDKNDPDPLQASDNIEIDPLRELDSNTNLNLQKKKTKQKPVQVTVEWRKKTNSDVRNIVNSIGYLLISFIVSREKVVNE